MVVPVLIAISANFILELIKPFTTRKIKKTENFLNAKRDAYYGLIDALTQHFTAITWTNERSETTEKNRGNPPSEAYVNSCIARVALFTSNDTILEEASSLFIGSHNVNDLIEFFILLRNDLQYDNSKINPEKYRYVVMVLIIMER
jgi:hypothetical protein